MEASFASLLWNVPKLGYASRGSLFLRPPPCPLLLLLRRISSLDKPKTLRFSLEASFASLLWNVPKLGYASRGSLFLRPPPSPLLLLRISSLDKPKTLRLSLEASFASLLWNVPKLGYASRGSLFRRPPPSPLLLLRISSLDKPTAKRGLPRRNEDGRTLPRNAARRDAMRTAERYRETRSAATH